MMTTLLNNRYQIIRLLGAGGFGETFLAEDTHMPSKRRCVIKQLKPVTRDPQLYQLIQQRFQREAATLESLGESSDQIPKLFAYFSENGQFYLVQEWIQGQTLADKVETDGPLSENRVREILISLLRVLDYVHSQGIIYRDIKPDNIILRQPNGKPVLIDFGAVKETMATVVNSQGKITQTMVVGTPGFMSPEQAAGRPIYASDVYSLGLTAIYMLTGKQPQELELDAQNEDILWQRYTTNVSPSLVAVINKAIQYHPRDRYTTAMKMLEDLQSVNNTSTSLPPATQVTVVVAPGEKRFLSPQHHQATPVAAPLINPAASSPNWQKFLIPGILLALSLIGVGVVVNLVRKPPQPEISTTQRSSTSNSAQQPVAESTPIATESIDPLAPEPTPEIPAPIATPSPSPSATTPAVSEPQTNQPEATPQPEATTQPTQIPSPTPDAPDAKQDNSVGEIPGFPTGTSENTVRSALGNPTKTTRGVWGNTRAQIYELKPNQVTLGYLFDRNSGRLRQTEVSFAQSVDPQVLQQTLQSMLGNNASAEINQGLQRVYQRSANSYSFTTGGLKGVIERNSSDRIYIGIWEADLH